MSRNLRGTRKSDLPRRRGRSSLRERFILFAKKFGFSFAAFIFVLWLLAWFILSGASERVWQAATNGVIESASEQGLRVENILIEGRQYTDPELLRAIINTNRGDPLFSFYPERVQPLIEEITWVKSAKVMRELPDTIRIILEERVPYAIWQNSGQVTVIDKEGEVLTAELQPEFADLMMVAGEGAASHAEEIIELLKAEHLLMNEVDVAVFVGQRRWDLKLKNGIRVELPEKDVGYALRRLAVAQEKDNIFSKNIAVIDLREPERIIVEGRQ